MDRSMGGFRDKLVICVIESSAGGSMDGWIDTYSIHVPG